VTSPLPLKPRPAGEALRSSSVAWASRGSHGCSTWNNCRHLPGLHSPGDLQTRALGLDGA